MSRRDKLIARLKSRPRDFTWEELVRLLEGLGYVEARAGKSAGFPAALRSPDRSSDRFAQAAPWKHCENVRY